MLSKRPALLVLVVVMALVLGATVRAQAAGEEPAGRSAEAHDRTDRPWAENVSDDAQKNALLLYEEGNKLFENGQHAAALARYREALKAWDHPAIRYNAAVALIHLDQPLAAYENLEPALRYGAAPFSAETYQQALMYRKLLRGQLAELKVACAEQGAEVTLDGQSLFAGPGETTQWLLPGPHQLVARKAGFLTETRSLNLLPGKPSDERLALQDIRSLPVRTVRRWPVWKPWSVLGAGALLALVGVPLILDASSNRDAFDAAVAECSKQMGSMGCPAGMVPPTALDARDTGHVENIVAISVFAVGGVVAASGIALLLLNQPRAVPPEGVQASVTPLLGPGTFGLSLAVSR